MQVLYTHCAGLDVHKRTVVACCLTPDPEGGWHHETRTFQTMTVDLLALADWLREREVTHVAMESTGEYWRPVFNILEAEFATRYCQLKHFLTKMVAIRGTRNVPDLNIVYPKMANFV